MCNCFNLCLFKLFKIKNEANDNEELNKHNTKLEQQGLNSFEHRLVIKMATFAHKIVNNRNSPADLKALLKPRETRGSTQLRSQLQTTNSHAIVNINHRHNNAIVEPFVRSKVGTLAFAPFFSKFINNFCVADINKSFTAFNSFIFQKINVIFPVFVQLFPNFDLINKNFDYLIEKKDT